MSGWASTIAAWVVNLLLTFLYNKALAEVNQEVAAAQQTATDDQITQAAVAKLRAAVSFAPLTTPVPKTQIDQQEEAARDGFYNQITPGSGSNPTP